MAQFSMHSFIKNIAQSREGELFKHPRKGYAGRVGNQILFFETQNANHARDELHSALALHKNHLWTNALLAHQRMIPAAK